MTLADRYNNDLSNRDLRTWEARKKAGVIQLTTRLDDEYGEYVSQQIIFADGSIWDNPKADAKYKERASLEAMRALARATAAFSDELQKTGMSRFEANTTAAKYMSDMQMGFARLEQIKDEPVTLEKEVVEAIAENIKTAVSGGWRKGYEKVKNV